MTDKPSDRAIAQAFREWCETSGAWRAHKLADTWIDKRAREIDAAAPDGAQAVAEVAQREPYLDGTPNPMKALRWSLPNCEDDLPVGTKLYTTPPSLGGEDGETDSLMDTINCAARDLPEGWQIEIGVECGAGWVNLYEDGSHVDLELTSEDTIEEQVRASISFAIAASRGEG